MVVAKFIIPPSIATGVYYDQRHVDLNAESMLALQQLQRDLGKTIVMVTHDPKAASRAGRLIHLEKGVLVPDDEMPRQAGH